MSIGIPNQEAVATSWLKTGYLAIFCLLGPSRGYDYARSRSAVTIRNQILNPLNQKVAGKYVMDGTENTPDVNGGVKTSQVAAQKSATVDMACLSAV